MSNRTKRENVGIDERDEWDLLQDIDWKLGSIRTRLGILVFWLVFLPVIVWLFIAISHK